jgi:hypothetical protein
LSAAGSSGFVPSPAHVHAIEQPLTRVARPKPVVNTSPVGTYEGKLKQLHSGRRPAERITFAITDLGGGQFQARTIGAPTMDFAAGYIALRGGVTRNKINLSGDTLSTDAFGGVNAGGTGVTEALTAVGDRGWKHLRVTWTVSINGTSTKMTWAGPVKRVS